jgi:hypothetical protein
VDYEAKVIPKLWITYPHPVSNGDNFPQRKKVIPILGDVIPMLSPYYPHIFGLILRQVKSLNRLEKRMEWHSKKTRP